MSGEGILRTVAGDALRYMRPRSNDGRGIEIRAVSPDEYEAIFGASQPPVARHIAAGRAAGEYGLALAAFMDGLPCGALLAGYSETAASMSIMYVFVSEGARRQGVSTALIRAAILVLKAAGVDAVSAMNGADAPFRDFVDSALRKNGFAEDCVQVSVTNHRGAAAEDEFNRFKLERGISIASRLAARGCAVKSFRGSSADELKRLYMSMGVTFPAHLNPFLLTPRLSAEMSSIVYKERIPIAYCAVTKLSRGALEVSFAACARGYKNTGAAMLALMTSWDAFFASRSYDRVVFTCRGDNKDMMNMLDTPLTNLPGSSRREAESYRLSISKYENIL
jgi:GNAT superfamily N-acetyltransferase